MRLLRHGAHVCAPVLLATHLNCPASCALLTRSPDGATYFITGKVNGDVVFFAIDQEHVGRFKCAIDTPVTAIAVGDLRHQGTDELVTILADGLLQSVGFPSFREGKIEPPLLIFAQLLNANICAAQLIDIDCDGRTELIVIMTDRVVRTYRFMESRLVPLNKWEVPAQISGISIGATGCGKKVHALLAQLNQSYMVRIDFAPNNSVTLPQSMVSDARNCQFDVPVNPIHVSLIGSLTNKLLVVNAECNTETELKNLGGDVVCISTVTLSNGLRLIVTVDMRGVLLVYGWLDNLVNQTCPLAQCQVLPEAVHLDVMPATEENTIMVGMSTVYFKIAIYKINLSPVVKILNR